METPTTYELARFTAAFLSLIFVSANTLKAKRKAHVQAGKKHEPAALEKEDGGSSKSKGKDSMEKVGGDARKSKEKDSMEKVGGDAAKSLENTGDSKSLEEVGGGLFFALESELRENASLFEELGEGVFCFGSGCFGKITPYPFAFYLYGDIVEACLETGFALATCSHENATECEAMGVRSQVVGG